MSIKETAGRAKREPALRFPEFEGGWEKFTIGALASVITGNTPSTSNPEYYGGDHQFVSPADIAGNGAAIISTQKTLTDLGFDKTRKIRAGATLFVCIGSTIGKVALASKECATNQQINAVVPNKHFDDSFVFYALVKRSPKIRELTAVQAVPIINKSTFSKERVDAPSLPEQKKIAAFLGVVDAKIARLKARQEGLERYKRGLMQALFSQRLRFTKPDGTGFPDWEEKRLGEVFSEVTEKVGEQDLRTFSISAGKGWVSQEEKFGKDISGQQNAKYTALKVGDFSYNKGNSKSYKYGCIYPNETGETIGVPNVFISFRANSSQTVTGFYGSLFENHHLDWGLRRLISSGARMDGLLNVNKGEFFKLVVPEPHPDEQQKIADALQAMDAKIAAVAGQLAKMEDFKKGLLQQMFV